MKYKSLFFISLTVIITVIVTLATQEKNNTPARLQANLESSKNSDDFTSIQSVSNRISAVNKHVTVNQQPHSSEEFNCNEESELKEENQRLRDNIRQLRQAKNSTQEFDPDPALDEVNKYKTYLLSEERDTEWVDYIQPTLEEASDSTEFEGVSVIATECRSTICQMELYTENSMQSDLVEAALLEKLSAKSVGITLRKFEEPTGGVRMYVFMTRNGASLQHMIN
ncbi:MAG: hypothetical protein GXP14_14115 [Gammaproteobacteria bacterium]|nr:hypothetical protein [Gammaproteobacteria bacterium]